MRQFHPIFNSKHSLNYTLPLTRFHPLYKINLKFCLNRNYFTTFSELSTEKIIKKYKLENLFPAPGYYKEKEGTQKTLDLEIEILKACKPGLNQNFQCLKDTLNCIIPFIPSLTIEQAHEICQLVDYYGYLNPPLINPFIDWLVSFYKADDRLTASDSIKLLRYCKSQNLISISVLKLVENYLNSPKKDLDGFNTSQLLYFYSLIGPSFSNIGNHLLYISEDNLITMNAESLIDTILSIFLLELENSHFLFLKKCLNRLMNSQFNSITYVKPDTNKEYFRKLKIIFNCFKYLLPSIFLEFPDYSFKFLHLFDESEYLYSSKPPSKFIIKFSELLTKLRISHYTQFRRDPYIFDIIESDRKIIWNLNSFHQYYCNSLDPLTTEKLKSRLSKAMGFIVINCPYWHWSKMKVKRTKLEYIRMTRYYSLRDNRELDINFQGWTLPYIHLIDPKSKNIYHKDFFQ